MASLLVFTAVSLLANGQDCPCSDATIGFSSPVPDATGPERFMSQDIWNMMMSGVTCDNGASCPGFGFWEYDGFMEATKNWPDFATSGDWDNDRREVAAFLATTSQETNGGWDTAPCGKYSWGYCFISEVGCSDDNDCLSGACKYADGSDNCQVAGWGFSCLPVDGKCYYGRGPIQVSYNYNYGLFSKQRYGDESIMLNDPDQIGTNKSAAWDSGLWFWMTPQDPKPSCHDIMQKNYCDESTDLCGFGLTTTVINGGVECGGEDCDNPQPTNRAEFYMRYTSILGVEPCLTEGGLHDHVLCNVFNQDVFAHPENGADKDNACYQVGLCSEYKAASPSYFYDGETNGGTGTTTPKGAATSAASTDSATAGGGGGGGGSTEC